MKVVGNNIGKLILLGFVQTFLQYALFYKGLSFVPGALSAMVVGSGPLFIAIVAHFLMPGDTITGKKLLSITVGLVGIAIISIGRKGFGSAAETAGIGGIIILIANNIMSGFGNILWQPTKDEYPHCSQTFSMILGGAMLFILGLLLRLPLNYPFL